MTTASNASYDDLDAEYTEAKQHPNNIVSQPESQHNDTGNANALIEAHGDAIRFVPGWGWLAYDGQRWQRDAEHLVIELAKKTILAMFWQAGKSEDTYQRDRLLRHAKASLASSRLDAMLKLAKSDPRIRAKVEDFDTDPMLFNCANGTIDLRTGEVRPHSPDDLITQSSPVSYDPQAKSPMFDSFITWVSDDRPDLASYLQQAMGYSLTGDTGEKGFFFAFGATGDNGKTTLLEATLYVMGDYGVAVSPQVILSKNGVSGDGERDATQLVGKRYVITSEPEPDQQFRMGQIKRLTGSDTMTARYLYQQPFEFRPRLKLWFAANRRPDVPESNDAAWNRIKFIPFDARISKEKKDPQLGAKLREAAPAILAWMVQGVLAWQQGGELHEPECMREATKDYRADQDSFQEFLDEYCEPSEGEITRTQDILGRYNMWAEEDAADRERLNQKTITTRLEEHGYKTKRASGGKVAIGLKLKQRTSSSRASSWTGPIDRDDEDDPYHGW